jgi:hypothetical protein
MDEISLSSSEIEKLSKGKERPITQAWLAKMLTPGERGKERDRPFMNVLADILGTSVQWLRTGTNIEIPPAAAYSMRIAAKSESTVKLTNVLAGEGLYRTLQTLYPGNAPLEFNGGRVPVSFVSAHPDQWDNVDSALVGLSPDQSPDRYSLPEIYSHVQSLVHRHSQLCEQEEVQSSTTHNDVTYDLDEILNTKKGVQVKAKLGRYFNSVCTSDSLEDEIVDALAADPARKVDLNQLPLRSRLHNLMKGKSPVTDGSFRGSALGLTGVVIFCDENKDNYNFLIHPRSDAVQTYHYLPHSIPSGMFQPVVFPDEPEKEFSVKHNFLREFYEELYGAEDSRNQTHPAWFYNEPPILNLMKRLELKNKKKGAELCFTGIGINLMNLRADFLVLLLVRDPDWYRQESTAAAPHRMKLNIEYLARNLPVPVPLAKALGSRAPKTLRCGSTRIWRLWIRVVCQRVKWCLWQPLQFMQAWKSPALS